MLSPVDDLFDSYGIKEDDAPPISKTMEKNPSSTATLKIASKWLRNCLENHNSCASPNFHRPPKRLINIGNETQNPFLVEVPPGGEQIKWLCLSYCWGKEQPALKLKKDTMNMLRSGVALNTLDPTIRDAIFVTRAVKVTYL